MLLMIGSSYLADNTAFEIRMNEELVGFFAFAMKGSERHLDHLWIAPKHIKTGIGRQALQYTDKLAQEQGWTELLTYPDPPAEAFYLKNGYIDTGLRMPSRIEGGPQFSVFRKMY
jgi:GNAT superfamily N-acetyltransferase